ncbi:MAG: chemotaxis protein CheW [Rhodospirillales bacterium]|nr:chemotaxis protein CheW [Rhodospirillales bacterium]
MANELTSPLTTGLAHSGEVETDEYVTFRVGNQLFGVPILKVRDILHLDKIAYIPLAPDQVRGSINLRGHIVTVIDVRICLGMEELKAASRVQPEKLIEAEEQPEAEAASEIEAETEDETKARVSAEVEVLAVAHQEAPLGGDDHKIGVTVEYGTDLYTLLVDQIGEVISVPMANKEGVPSTLDSAWHKFARHIVQLPGDLLVILDSDMLVDPTKN